MAYIVFFVVGMIAWACYGYFVGRPYGLGREGVKHAMFGIIGMIRFNRVIEERVVTDRERASEAENKRKRLGESNSNAK